MPGAGAAPAHDAAVAAVTKPIAAPAAMAPPTGQRYEPGRAHPPRPATTAVLRTATLPRGPTTAVRRTAAPPRGPTTAAPRCTTAPPRGPTATRPPRAPARTGMTRAAGSLASIEKGATGWSGAESEGQLDPISASIVRTVADRTSCGAFVERFGVDISFTPGILQSVFVTGFAGGTPRLDLSGRVTAYPSSVRSRRALMIGVRCAARYPDHLIGRSVALPESSARSASSVLR